MRTPEGVGRIARNVRYWQVYLHPPHNFPTPKPKPLKFQHFERVALKVVDVKRGGDMVEYSIEDGKKPKK